MDERISELNAMIREARNVVFFGGAGVSTESGIPDFRSVDGLYSQKYDQPPEYILSHTCFVRDPELFYRFYRDKMLAPYAQPNAAHRKLAEMEQAGKLSAIITQNIDGLHQKAGSKNVLELHGSVLRNYCTECGEFYPVSAIADSRGIPKCSCGGTIKPDVVLYEEGLNDGIIRASVKALSAADLLIVAGTSLVVYPAAGLINYYGGKKTVIVNLSDTAFDGRATLHINAKVGDVMRQIKL